MKLPVYSRADLSRNVIPVVAPFLTAGLTGAVAWEFRATDTRTNDHPAARAPRDTNCGDSRISLQRCRSISDAIDAPALRRIDGRKTGGSSFVATDHYKYGGHCITESMMSPEVLIVSHKARETRLAGRRRISRDAATVGMNEKTRRGHAAKPVERMRKVE
jgi:hypothetical protein